MISLVVTAHPGGLGEPVYGRVPEIAEDLPGSSVSLLTSPAQAPESPDTPMPDGPGGTVTVWQSPPKEKMPLSQLPLQEFAGLLSSAALFHLLTLLCQLSLIPGL